MGGGTGGAGGAPVANATLKQFANRKSVLDFAIEELNQLNRMVPMDARNNLDIHTKAVIEAEGSVASAIDANYPPLNGAGGRAGGMGGRGGSGGGPGTGAGGSSGDGGMCRKCSSKPDAPPSAVGGVDPDNGRGTGNNYGGNDGADQDDSVIHQQVGKAHLDVLKAAFVCDLIRVGTYQWSPGTNHVGFKQMPNSTGSFQHHPVSHRLGTGDTTVGTTPDGITNMYAHFLYNVQLWYFARHAENFAAWKTTVDGCGNSLLDFTCVPFVTEVRATGHERTDMPAMIIGGKQLGFAHNIYKSAATISINSFWGTIAQAYGYGATAPFAAPVAGIWAKPAGT